MNLFWSRYVEQLTLATSYVDAKELDHAATAIMNAGRIFVAGNGGSCAIANHLSCDFMKGCHPHRILDVESLSANTSLLTALANDTGYENTLAAQLDVKLQNTSDLLILISSSGNSPNIVKAAELAQQRGCPVIGFTGFDGGKLRQLASIRIHVNSDNYGVIEDTHQACMHAIAQYIKDSCKNPNQSGAV